MGATLRCGTKSSHCGCFCCCEAEALGCRAFSSCGMQVISCGAQVLVLHGVWGLPRPGIEPMSPALAGGFFTTTLPRKSQATFFFFSAMLYDMWDLSSLIKDQTHVPCVDRTEFQPLDHWGSPDTRAEGPQALPSQLAGTRRGSGS